MRPSNLAACALAAVACVAGPLGARAGQIPSTTFWFAGTRLIFDSPIALNGDVAVSIHDSGLARILARVGASLSYQRDSRYVVITTADRRIVSFTIGDNRYTAANVTATATFAPFFDGNDVIVPLYAVARALYLSPVQLGTEVVLEPQLGALDVRSEGRRTIVTLHGATPLRYSKLNETPDRLAVTFAGTSSALAPDRSADGGLREFNVAVSGGARNPLATVTLAGAKGSQHIIAASASPFEFTVIFGPPGVALGPSAVAPAVAAAAQPVAAAAAPPAPAPPPPAAPTAPPRTAEIAPAPAASVQPEVPASPPAGAASVTDVAVEPQADGGMRVRLAIAGTAAYSWHRLLDDRWYLDLANVALAAPSRDEHPAAESVDSLRIKQIGTADSPVTRVAFTLRGDRRVDVTPAQGALIIDVGPTDEANLARTGNGQLGGATVAQATAPPAGPPAAPIASPGQVTSWKFGPSGPGSRLIVIDPGHGGGDSGTAHNGLVEKEITLDISRRLRSLLVAAGWDVRLTRDSDVDPLSPALEEAFANDGRPNPDDRAYLQTRCDVANNANARLFISIHVNYADATDVHGTTFYYTKPQDVPFAQALERSVIAEAGTQDDGVVKSNLYVTKHTNMPAVLIETGFISNPGDVRLLSDPAFLQNIALGIADGVKAYAGALPAVSTAQ